MIIDVHNHIGKNNTINSTKGKILAEQRKAGVDYSIIFPLHNNDYDNLNKSVINTCIKEKSLIPFLRVRSDNDLKKMLKKYDGKFRGVKIHTKNDNIGMKSLNEIAGIAENNNLIVLFHSDNEIILDCEPVIKEFRKVNFIAAHGTSYEDYLAMYKKYDNLFFGTSIKMSPMSMKRLSSINPEKLLFGSDYPYSTPLIERMRFELAPEDYLSRKHKSLILGLNARKLLGL